MVELSKEEKIIIVLALKEALDRPRISTNPELYNRQLSRLYQKFMKAIVDDIEAESYSAD